MCCSAAAQFRGVFLSEASILGSCSIHKSEDLTLRSMNWDHIEMDRFLWMGQEFGFWVSSQKCSTSNLSEIFVSKKFDKDNNGFAGAAGNLVAFEMLKRWELIFSKDCNN